jgi:transcription elongation factor GreA
MNIQNNSIILKKIAELKAELSELSEKIELERSEASEENPSLQELLDKKEILLTSIEELENPDETIDGANSDQINKTYNVEINGKVKKLKIVIPTEANPSEGLISSQSPLAQALNGKKKGDKIEVAAPMGNIVYILR